MATLQRPSDAPPWTAGLQVLCCIFKRFLQLIQSSTNEQSMPCCSWPSKSSPGGPPYPQLQGKILQLPSWGQHGPTLLFFTTRGEFQDVFIPDRALWASDASLHPTSPCVFSLLWSAKVGEMQLLAPLCPSLGHQPYPAQDLFIIALLVLVCGPNSTIKGNLKYA